MPRSSEKTYKVLIPRTKEWPIVKLNKERKAFIHQVIEESYQLVRAHQKDTASFRSLLENTIYKEKSRVSHYKWKVDETQKEGAFWKTCEQSLFLPTHNDKEEQSRCEALLKTMISHYVHEIMSKFQRKHYKLIASMVTGLLMRLLNATHLRIWALLCGKRIHLYDKIHTIGAIDQVRKLARENILVFVPTHFSNIDSIILGWVIRHIGLPPLMYGAGINLFNMRVFAYFMHRLGAYKVDRRKKGTIYLETLKIFTKDIIKNGCHSLFYPGGTRSRDGRIETKLKLGLLSTTIAAQREFYTENLNRKSKKVFIIPVVISYHFVLEAPSLIRNFLKKSGKGRYYQEIEDPPALHKILKFILALFTKSSNISVSIGRGLDVLGNYINDQGESVDKNNQKIDVKDYFSLHDDISYDPQREHEYTKKLSEAIVKEYYRCNQVLCSHVVAFVAFETIAKQHPEADLYTLLRLPLEEIRIPYEGFISSTRQVLEKIYELHAKEQLQHEKTLGESAYIVFKKGITHCGMYHSLRPLFQDKHTQDICTEDLGRLYYYHNRLVGYEIESVL